MSYGQKHFPQTDIIEHSKHIASKHLKKSKPEANTAFTFSVSMVSLINENWILQC